MGDAQSAQRKDEKDAAAGEESGTADGAQSDKPLKNNRQLSKINGKADSSKEVNVHCEDEITAEGLAILSPGEDVSETEKLLKEETPLENVEMYEKEPPTQADANEEASLEMTEMDAKQNDINDSFRRFFSNIGLKFTVKKGSGETATDVPNETDKEEPNRPDQSTCGNAEQNTDVNTAQEMRDSDSTTCPTLTDVTSEDVLENAEERTTETKEEVESDNAHAITTSPVREDAHQDNTPEEEPLSRSPSSPEEEVVVYPIKRFFTTGIFSGLRKKKKPAEHEATDKEVKDMGKKEVVEKTEKTVRDQQQDKEEIGPGVQTTDASTTDPSTIVVTDPEILNSQERDKVQASPIKRLLSGSSLKKLSKKQRSRKSSDAKQSDSGEHVSDHLLSSTESTDHQNEEGCAQPSAETPAGEEDGAWASFKKLLTPKKRMKKSSMSNEETQEEPKPSEGGQISDHSTEEGKKRKDSTVSWESVLCGSGRRRSRKTSDSEEDTPQIAKDITKQDSGSKYGAEWALEYEADEILAYSPQKAVSSSEGDGASTWKSLKRLVTPKRKATDEDESKDNVQSDTEVTQDESFTMKKLLPGRKKRKSNEKQDQVSSDEADKDAASGDEDSDTPAVVPLSEFDVVETEVNIQTWADVERHIPKEADLLDQKTEPVLSCDSLQTEAKKIQDNDDTVENRASKTPATNEVPDDLTDSISKQQLSDIPEEATPASATEEAARDDTIAEDLIEITSEAVTAPEPLDVTLADETEMISAVSQLSSESSKTSGNTTPVPADYVFKETDVLLHQVIETISISPNSVPVISDELRSERILVSVSNQILETLVEQEPRILEMHRRFDATKIDTGLNVQELDAVKELAATIQTESIPEVNNSAAKETVSDDPTEEFHTAEIAVDEVESMLELESIDESHHLLESLSEVNAAVSTNILPEHDEMSPDDGSLVEAPQTETETQKVNSQEADSTVADETMDGAMEQEVLSLTKKEDQIMHNITDKIQVEDNDQLPEEGKELQELAAVQAATLDSEEGSAQLLEKDVISEDTSTAETITEETVPLTEVAIEQENKELPVNVIKTVQDPEISEAVQSLDASETEHVQGPEASEAEQASTLDSEEGSIQSPNQEVRSEDIPPSETITDEQKQTAERLDEVSVEPEDKEPPANVINTVQEPEVLESGQACEKDSSKNEHVQEQEVSTALQATEEGGVQSVEKEVISENAPEGKTVTDEPKEETIPFTEANLQPVDASKEPEVLEAVQAPTLASETSDLLSLEKKVISEDIPAVETLTDEPKQEAEVEAEEKLPVEAVKTKDVQDPQVLPSDVNDIVTETKTEGTLMSEHLVTETTEGGSAQKLEKQILFEAHPKPSVDNIIASVTDGLEGEVVTKLDHSLEKGEDQEKKSIPQDGGVEQGAPCVDNSAITNEPKYEAHLSAVQVHVEGEKESEFPGTDIMTVDGHALEVQVVSAEIPDDLIEDASPITERLIERMTSELVFKEEVETATPLVKDDVAETAVEGSEVVMMHVPSVVDASKIDLFHKPEVLEVDQAPAIDSEEGSVRSFEKEAISENVPEEETVTDEPKEDTIPLAEANLVPEDAPKTEYVQEPEVLEAVQAPTSDSEVGSLLSLEKDVISENVPEEKTVTDEPKEDTMPLTEANLVQVDASETEHVQEPEVLEAVQAPTSDSEAGSLLSLEKEVISDDIPAVETVTDEPKQKAEIEAEERLPLEAAKTKEVQEPQVSPSDVKDIVPGTKTDATLSPAPCVDNAAVTDEPKHEVHLTAVQVCVEGEKESEFPGIERTTAAEHAVVAQVVICNVKEVSTEIPDVLIENTSPITEALIERVTNELKTATPLVKDDASETAVEASEVVMMHVPSVELEDNHRIQVQVVSDDIESAETSGDTVLIVQITDVKEILDIPHETFKKIDNLSATAETEEELINQENNVTIQEVFQHVKENLPETVHESGIKLKTAVAAEEVKSNQIILEGVQIIQSLIVTPCNTGLVAPPNTGIISSIGHVESPSSFSIESKLSIQFGQANEPASTTTFEDEVVVPVKPNKQIERTEVAVQPTETTEPAANLDSMERATIATQTVLQAISNQAMEPVEQIESTERVTSSVQANKPASPPPTTGRSKEKLEPVKPNNQTELTEVAVQATETKEPATNLDPTERATSVTQTVLLAIGKQVMEPVEQIESTAIITSIVQETEMQTDNRGAFLSQPVLPEACDQETKAEGLVKHKDEDQEVWTDAEEDINAQKETEASSRGVEESLEPQTVNEQEEQAGLEEVVEMAPKSKTEERGRQLKMHTTAETCGTDSEEDFAVALEHPEAESASVTTMEWN